MSRRRILPIAIVAAAVLLVAVVVLVSFDDEGDDSAAAPPTTARIATPEEAGGLAEEVGHPVYWVGERPGTQLELREEPDGSVYLRYLPAGVEAGDPRTDFLTVGSYPLGDGEAAVRKAAREAGAELVDVPGGGIAFLSPDGRSSAYVAFPGSPLEIEVYDPVAGRALGLAEAGRVVPAG